MWDSTNLNPQALYQRAASSPARERQIYPGALSPREKASFELSHYRSSTSKCRNRLLRISALRFSLSLPPPACKVKNAGSGGALRFRVLAAVSFAVCGALPLLAQAPPHSFRHPRPTAYPRQSRPHPQLLKPSSTPPASAPHSNSQATGASALPPIPPPPHPPSTIPTGPSAMPRPK